MADTKISGLTALTGANTASGDLLTIVDISDTTMAATGTNKKITLTELQGAPVSAGTANGVLYLNGSKVATSGSALVFDGTNLLVGTTTAYKLLTVNGNASINNTLYVRQGATDYGLLYANGNAFGFESFQGAPITWATGAGGTATETMRLTSTGLGIGTSSPSTKLEVAQNSSGVFNPSATISGTSAGAVLRLAFDSQGARVNIVGGRDSATAGSTAAYMAFETRQSGGGMTEAMRLDSSGNLGLGVTPSAWVGSKSLSLSASGAVYGDGVSYDYTAGISQNAYRASSTQWNYRISSVTAARFDLKNNTFEWHIAGSGTAGNAITFTQAMTLDASGDFQLGTTSSTFGNKMTIVGGSGGDAYLTVGDGTRTGYIGSNGTVINIGSYSNTPITFNVNDAEKARIDSSGNLGLGVTPSSWGSGYAGFDIKYLGISNTGAGTVDCSFTQNGYYNGTNWIAKYTSPSKRFSISDNGFAFFNGASATAGNAITFTQAMTLDSSGNLLVGTTSANANLSKGLQIASANWGSAITVTAAANSGTCAAWGRSSDGNVGQFYRDTSFTTLVGSISVTSSATAYNTSSDYRLKDNPQPLTGSGAFIDALKPKTWNWKADGSKGVGLIAHEVQEVSPGSVVGQKDAIDEDGKPIMQAMEYGSAEFIANIIAELQSLRARVAALES